MPSSLDSSTQTIAEYLNETQRVPCSWNEKIPTSTHHSSKSVQGLSGNTAYTITEQDIYRKVDTDHSHTPEALLDQYIEWYGHNKVGNWAISQYHYNEAGMRCVLTVLQP